MKRSCMKLKWLAALALIFGSAMARADKIPYPDGQKWHEECSICHIAFPPSLLATKNWQKLMANLDKHFGANASLDAKDAQEILEFLERHSKNGSRQTADSLRISDTVWYKSVHREVPEEVWSNPAVKSLSNCAACHINAHKFDWSEKSIRLPGVVGGKYGEASRH